MKEILKCIFPEDAFQFSESKLCNQSNEETIEKEPDDVVLILYILFVQISVLENKNGV